MPWKKSTMRKNACCWTKIATRFGANLKGKNFALWGLAFKPNTDDMREASSRVIIQGLWEMGATVTAYDPVAMNESRRIFGTDPRLAYAERRWMHWKGADALLIVTEWKEFRAPDFDAVKASLKNPVIFDGRNMYDTGTREVARAGVLRHRQEVSFT